MKRRWVLVKWRDAYSPEKTTWIGREEIAEVIEGKEMIGFLCGALVHKDKNYITVICSLMDELEYDEVVSTSLSYYMRIPTKMVIEIQDLKPTSVKKTTKRKRARPVQKKDMSSVQDSGD